MGRKKIRGLKTRMGCECCISRWEATWVTLSSGDIPGGGVQGGSHSAGRCGRAAPGVRAAKSSDSRKGE